MEKMRITLNFNRLGLLFKQAKPMTGLVQILSSPLSFSHLESSASSREEKKGVKIRRLSPVASRAGSLFLLSAEEEPWPDTMLPMAVHPTTTPALSPRTRVSPPRPSTSLAATSSTPCSRTVSLKSSRLRLRSLRSVVAAAAADAVGAEEEEVQLSGGVDAVDEEEAEVMMAFRTH